MSKEEKELQEKKDRERYEAIAGIENMNATIYGALLELTSETQFRKMVDGINRMLELRYCYSAVGFEDKAAGLTVPKNNKRCVLSDPRLKLKHEFNTLVSGGRPYEVNVSLTDQNEKPINIDCFLKTTLLIMADHKPGDIDSKKQAECLEVLKQHTASLNDETLSAKLRLV